MLAGEIHTSEAMSRRLTQKFMSGGTPGKKAGLETLSDRELAVFQLIGQGQCTREIAQSLRLSVKTIESYREHLKGKLELATGAALNRCAILWQQTSRLH